MRIKKMQHKTEVLALQNRQAQLDKKRNRLFRSLAVIHALSRVIQIAYYDTIKSTLFRSPKIKAKSNQIEKFSEDIIKSLGDSVKLKEEVKDYMEYEHFSELYECLMLLTFVDTNTVKSIRQTLEKGIIPATEEELKELINK